MLRMRRLEEQVIHFGEDHEGLLRGHYHVYIGQERRAPACATLRPTTTCSPPTGTTPTWWPRAATWDPGRDHRPRRRLLQGPRRAPSTWPRPDRASCTPRPSSAGCLPLAGGAAYAAKIQRQRPGTLVFFGDGAMEEGASTRRINIAQLWGLPVIFYMENNAVAPGERPAAARPPRSTAPRRCPTSPAPSA